MYRSEIAVMVETISNVTTQRTLVNQAIKIALDRVFEFHDWPYYMQEGALSTAATYTTGTLTATNGSKTLTGSGTTWDASWAGRKIRIYNDNAYYRILSVDSSTSITLEQSYQGTTGSAYTYTIFKDEYRLAADMDRDKTYRQNQNNIALFDVLPSDFDSVYPLPRSYSDPIYKMNVGSKLDVYTTGTIAASSKTITGVSTAWTSAEGLGRMSAIRIGNYVYTVKSVNSDTSITTYEDLSTSTAGTSYEVTLNNLLVQFFSIPNAQRVIYYRYFRRPALLANDYDVPDMPHSWHWLLIYGALSFIFLQKGDINKAQIESENRFIDGLNMMKLKIGTFAADRVYKRKSGDRARSGISDGIERSAFDRRYSTP